jgi:hypothetical protein
VHRHSLDAIAAATIQVLDRESNELGAVNGAVVEQRAETGCGKPLNGEMSPGTCYMPCSSKTVTALQSNEDALGSARHG